MAWLFSIFSFFFFVEEENVVEFATSDMVDTDMGQDHFTIPHSTESIHNQTENSAAECVTEIVDLPIDMWPITIKFSRSSVQWDVSLVDHLSNEM